MTVDHVTNNLLDLLNAGIIRIIDYDDKGEPIFELVDHEALDDLISNLEDDR